MLTIILLDLFLFILGMCIGNTMARISFIGYIKKSINKTGEYLNEVSEQEERDITLMNKIDGRIEISQEILNQMK